MAAIGTVSHGTLRSQDLIPAFLDVLRGENPAAHQQMTAPGVGFAAVPAHALEDDDADWWRSEDAIGVLDSLFDALDECAPEGCYFGAHPGDASDFGFWPVEE